MHLQKWRFLSTGNRAFYSQLSIQAELQEILQEIHPSLKHNPKLSAPSSIFKRSFQHTADYQVDYIYLSRIYIIIS